MLVNVIRGFPYTTDGLTTLHAAIGEREIPDALVPGLIADGYVSGEGHPDVAFTDSRRRTMIERLVAAFRGHLEGSSDAMILDMTAGLDEQERRAAPAAPETKVEPPLETGAPEPINTDIPADWSSLHWKQQVALAKAISGADVVDATSAKAIITAEVERRAALAEAA